jgi:sugar/nucleoside kinase (ribokinase family)
VNHPNLVVVGSAAYDTITTSEKKADNVLGGSALHFAMASEPLAHTGVVAVVGDDFLAEDRALLHRRGVDLRGLETQPGKTFRWGGVYDQHMKDRETLFTELNVFATFAPKLPEDYAASPYVFLANIHPDLQRHVLDQCLQPKWVACDTMNLWILNARDSLLALLPRVDALLLNDSEAFELTGYRNLPLAADWIMQRGPSTVVIKKGEHGAVLFHQDNVFAASALPLRDVRDPTGAGDSFAGGMMGTIARLDTVDFDSVRCAAVVGTCTASFCVQDFGPHGLAEMDLASLQDRVNRYRSMVSVPPFTF